MLGYSEQEQKLFTRFGYQSLMVVLDPVALYKIVGEECFVKKLDGESVESVRRCLFAMSTGTVFRGTSEWDAMIVLDS